MQHGWHVAALGVSIVVALYFWPMTIPDALIDPAMRRAVKTFEQNRLPDWLARAGTRLMLSRQLADQEHEGGPEGSEAQREYVRRFIADLRTRDIAEQTAAANEQHYELDARFYDLVLGKHRKYSCALFPSVDAPASTALDLLAAAEERMLLLYAERAQIAAESSLRVLDLGCGWGSVTLWFAAKFPNCSFVGLSNSKSQRTYILAQAKARGLTNVDVLTGDISTFELSSTGSAKFDRVISVEMLEHMKNYEKLLQKISDDVLVSDGLLFVHIFVHRTFPYHFTTRGLATDWMAQHFFSGGTMPADDTLLEFQKHLHLVERWRVDGRHYSLTLEAWLQQMDLRIDEVQALFAQIYGKENVTLWTARWRAFFFVCSELFKFNDGREWFVAHYLFRNS